MDRAQVNRAIKRLIEAGAVFEGPKVGISKTYRLNPSSVGVEAAGTTSRRWTLSARSGWRMLGSRA